jgi:hypothetical protein
MSETGENGSIVVEVLRWIARFRLSMRILRFQGSIPDEVRDGQIVALLIALSALLVMRLLLWAI